MLPNFTFVTPIGMPAEAKWIPFGCEPAFSTKWQPSATTPVLFSSCRDFAKPFYHPDAAGHNAEK